MLPAYKIEPLNQLPPEQWKDAWNEVTSTATNDKITRKHVQAVVKRRNQNQKPIATCEKSSFTPVVYTGNCQVGEIVRIKCERDATPEQREYDGCWAIVEEVKNWTVALTVKGKRVNYQHKYLKSLGELEPLVRDVCNRVTDLWSVLNLPPSVQFIYCYFFNFHKAYS